MGRSIFSSCAILIVVLMLIAGRQSAGQPAPAQRLPGNANAILTVEIARLLDSPMARKLGWQSKMIKGYADRPLAVPPSATRMTVVSGMNAFGMDAIWQAAVVELANPINLDPMLRAQGGYLDQIGGKRAAWTPRDIFYIELDKNTLGVVRPGQRQFVTRWITGKSQVDLSPYLKQAATSSSDADVVFAMDLDDFVGATAIHYADSMGQLPSLEKITEGRDKLINALASARGVKLTMKAKDQIDGELVIDFDQDVSALKDQAKPFVMDVLMLIGVNEPAIEPWQFKAEGKRIVGSGPMEPEALSRLLAMMAPGHAVDAVVAPKDDKTPSASADPKNTAAEASQAYYKTISKMIDSIGPKVSPTQNASWLINKARMIDQLPVLNVDPALLEWGAYVAQAFNQAAQELAVGQQRAQVASLGVASPTASGGTGYYSGESTGNDTPESRAAYRNAQQQRRQAAQAERGQAGEKAFNIMNQLLPTRSKIRIDMTQKYGVEF